MIRLKGEQTRTREVSQEHDEKNIEVQEDKSNSKQTEKSQKGQVERKEKRQEVSIKKQFERGSTGVLTHHSDKRKLRRDS